jgi:hypothetical protein
MTLQAFAGNTKIDECWVAIPLELVDWLAARFPTPFFVYLAALDPYGTQTVSPAMVLAGGKELAEVQQVLRNSREVAGVPERVDLFGNYGIAGAKQTIGEAMRFFESAASHGWQVVSIGD